VQRLGGELFRNMGLLLKVGRPVRRNEVLLQLTMGSWSEEAGRDIVKSLDDPNRVKRGSGTILLGTRTGKEIRHNREVLSVTGTASSS